MGVDTTFEDRRARLITIPLLGIGIPHAARAFGTLGPSSAAYWWGLAYFVGTSFIIWQGNRAIWMRLRHTPDRVRHPLRRAAVLISLCTAYTAAVLLALMAGWYWLRGLPPDSEATRISLVLAIIAVLFIVQAYETVDLIRQRAADKLAAAQAELEALKSQIDPHFLFNSLSNLAALVEENSARAGEFAVALGHLYRYVVDVRNQQLVSLGREMRFVDDYAALLAMRYDGRIRLTRSIAAEDLDRPVPPVSLQILIENVVKHNDLSAPLDIAIAVEGDALVVSHEKRSTVLAQSTGTGLRNLDSRCRLLTGRGLDVRDRHGRFAVALPLGLTPPTQSPRTPSPRPA